MIIFLKILGFDQFFFEQQTQDKIVGIFENFEDADFLIPFYLDYKYGTMCVTERKKEKTL